MTAGQPDNRKRLSPEMACFRGLVLAFVREYIKKYSISPSQGEIVNAIEGATKRKVRRALVSLDKEGLLIKKPGERGLVLPEARDAALRLLQEEGYQVHEPGGPEKPLLPPPALTYPKR